MTSKLTARQTEHFSEVLSPDLARAEAAWLRLPETVKVAIVTAVEAAETGGHVTQR